MRFAQMSTKIVMAHLVKNFIIEVDSETPLPFKYDERSMLLKPKGGVLKVKLRSASYWLLLQNVLCMMHKVCVGTVRHISKHIFLVNSHKCSRLCKPKASFIRNAYSVWWLSASCFTMLSSILFCVYIKLLIWIWWFNVTKYYCYFHFSLGFVSQHEMCHGYEKLFHRWYCYTFLFIGHRIMWWVLQQLWYKMILMFQILFL